MVSRSNSTRESSMWSMSQAVGLSSPVSRPSAKVRMWMPSACSSSMVLRRLVWRPTNCLKNWGKNTLTGNRL